QVLLSNHLDDLHLERRIERSPGLGFGHFYSSQTLISLIGMSFEIRPAQLSALTPTLSQRERERRAKDRTRRI
ncbi:hypothetical protein, partial [Polaromonas sp. YR568]|uniref:hypothetical protein n=1 Tax=Polaromonas sp. YR568 TaxID=1855301 RepID=UPI00398C1959